MERIEKLLADQKAEIAELTAQLADLKQTTTQVVAVVKLGFYRISGNRIFRPSNGQFWLILLL